MTLGVTKGENYDLARENYDLATAEIDLGLEKSDLGFDQGWKKLTLGQGQFLPRQGQWKRLRLTS